MGGTGRPAAGTGTGRARARWAGRLAILAAIAAIAAIGLTAGTSTPAGARPPAGPAHAAPNTGLTRKTALRLRNGRTYSVTLAPASRQRWVSVYDPWDPFGGCFGRCPIRDAGEAASALVGATVRSRGGSCTAHVTVQGPVLDETTGNTVTRRLAHGLVPSGTTFATDVVPTTYGRVYLGLSADPAAECRTARYTVRLTVQRALALSDFALVSASSAQYGQESTHLEQRQAICAQKANALDRYIGPLNAQIAADSRRRGLGAKVARLRAVVNAAESRFLAVCRQ